MQVSAASLAQRLTLVQKNVTLKQLFTEVNKQTGYSIIWSVSQVRGNVQVDVNFKDTPLLEALDKCLENTNLAYTIENKTVVIREKDPTIAAKIRSALNLSLTVSARVLDESGQPLPGVTVKEKGTANGVVTDAKGLFALTVADDKAVIVFSFVGFEPLELAAKDIASGSSVTLKAAVNNLKEVVVNKGYYSVKQELNTGNVSSVEGEDIAKQPVSDPLMALEGRVSGLYISQASGVPGSQMSLIRLRGQNSISNGNNPLFIVDGVPFTGTSLTNSFTGGGAAFLSPFATLNPSDIESIEVLKDADATSIYGSRGANGVIIITTTKGRPYDTRINFSVSEGAGKVTRMLQLLNTQQYLGMRHSAFTNDGVTPSQSDYDVNGTWDTTRYTNWEKAFIGNTSHYSKEDLSVSGGNSNTQFLFGGAYNKQTTVFPGDYNDQLGSGHLQINNISNDKRLRISLSSYYTYDNNKLPNVDFTNYITLAPDAPNLYNPDGSLNWQNNSWANPFASLKRVAKATTDNFLSTLTASYDLTKDLKFSSVFGYNRVEMDQSIIIPISSYPPQYSGFPILRKNTLAANSLKTWNLEPQINYHKKVGGSQFDALVGSTFQENNQQSYSEIASNFPSDLLITNIAAASKITVVSNDKTVYRYNAIFGRFGYNLNDKYLLNLTARRDGSSRFGSGFQFGNFGSVGAGWLFSKEKFAIDHLQFLSFGKFRASYGVTGNDQISDYQYLSVYTPYDYPYQGVSGLYPSNISNPYYHWEVVKKLEFGTELGFFNDRIFLNLSYYRNRTNNQLVGYSLPTITGFSSIIANLPATIQNTGIEIEINTTNVSATDFKWSTSANISIPRNKLVSYPNLAGSSYANQYIIGESLYTRKLYHYTGINPETGIYSFRDVDNDGQITYPNDLTAEKQLTQDFFGGVKNSFSYKRLQLDLFFQFVKQTGYSNFYAFSLPGLVNANQPIGVLNSSENGTVGTVQKFTQSYGTPAGQAYSLAHNSDAIITDASFIRLKNLSLSYELPTFLESKINVHSLKFLLQCQNLITFTKYKGLDPETQLLSLPPIKMITAGLQITL